MKTRRQKFFIRLAIVAALIIGVSYYRTIANLPEFDSAVRVVIISNVYIALLAIWTITIQRRLMHRRARHYLLMISVSLLILIILRVVKHGIFDSNDLLRNLMWDWFYVPQLFVGLFSYRVTQVLSRDEDEKLPFKEKLPTGIPTHILVILTMTNRLHGLVLDLENDNHKIGYFLIAAWIFILCFAGLRKMIAFSHADVKRRHYCIVAFSLAILWLILYVIFPGKNRVGFIEFVATISIITIGLWEFLIQIDMVPTNIEYALYLANSSIKVQIFDNHGIQRYKSKGALDISSQQLEEIREKGSIMWNENTEINSVPVIAGLAVWEQDISEINGILDELMETRDSISFASETLRKNISIEGRKHSLSEQNRLYDLIISNTDFQIALIERYLELARNATGEALVKLMREINVYGAYIKRKSNLVLVSNEDNSDLYKEIQLAFTEILNNVTRARVECSYNFKGSTRLTIDVALLMMDILESSLELSLPLLDSLYVITQAEKSDIRLTVSMVVKSGIKIRENFFKESFDRWEEVIEDNFLGSLDMENEDQTFTISMFIPTEMGVSV